MVNWHRYTPSDFEYDFEQDKLAVHGVTFSEAVGCFVSNFEVRRTRNSKIAINELVKQSVVAASRSFFNSNQTASYVSSLGGRYDWNE